MGNAPTERYKEAGVDIRAGDAFVEKIAPLLGKTRRPEVRGGIGHYASLFAWPAAESTGYLAASTDGVGTKLLLARQLQRWDTIGQDLVAMCANDLICVGAQPLFFLDYLATGRLEAETATAVVSGIATACQEVGCALVGGETAEMPDLYAAGDLDLAGFIVGWVSEKQLIDGAKIKPGDTVIGLAANGFHSNGYSLLRKILDEQKPDLTKPLTGETETLGSQLLCPTPLYGPRVTPWLKKYPIHGLAHITGGGLVGNLPRILPPSCRIQLERERWPRRPLYQTFQEWGQISEAEMLKVFNDGIGLVIILPADAATPLLKEAMGTLEAWTIGTVLPREPQQPAVAIG